VLEVAAGDFQPVLYGKWSAPVWFAAVCLQPVPDWLQPDESDCSGWGIAGKVRSGTGSRPPFPQGWQRASLHMASHDPRTHPNRLTAMAAYSEQVGRYRQRDGLMVWSMGESTVL
jgi:hypothetical protein